MIGLFGHKKENEEKEEKKNKEPEESKSQEKNNKQDKTATDSKQAKIDELTELVKRIQAEFENFKKREEKYPFIYSFLVYNHYCQLAVFPSINK